MKDRNFEKWNEELFRKYASKDRYVHPNALVRFAANVRADAIVRELRVRPTDDVLDVGCGSGYIMKRIRTGSGRVTGIDLSETALSMARSNLSGRTDFVLLKADAEKMPFKDGSFDRVICADVLEHVPRPEKVMAEICRVAKPGARVVIALPNESLQRWIIRAAYAVGLLRMLNGVDSHREWHIHNAGIGFFRKINDQLDVVRVIRSPAFFFPLTYVFVCRKGMADNSKTH